MKLSALSADQLAKLRDKTEEKLLITHTALKLADQDARKLIDLLERIDAKMADDASHAVERRQTVACEAGRA